MMFLKESLEANFCYVCVAFWQVGSIDDWTQRNKELANVTRNTRTTNPYIYNTSVTECLTPQSSWNNLATSEWRDSVLIGSLAHRCRSFQSQVIEAAAITHTHTHTGEKGTMGKTERHKKTWSHIFDSIVLMCMSLCQMQCFFIIIHQMRNRLESQRV